MGTPYDNRTAHSGRTPARSAAYSSRRLGAHWLLGIGLVLTVGCLARSPGPELIVYTALDEEFSAPIFEEFTRQTGIRVRPKYDTEANKTVGLTNLILNEKQRPRCDLFWNNEILNTIRLQQNGLLATFASRQAKQIPPAYRAVDETWCGFAARARILLVNTELVAADEYPDSIEDLADSRWRGRVGIAKPLFGTTASHAACLYQVWGDEKADEFFAIVKENAVVLPGNRQVAQAVANQQIAFGLTDTDDAILEIERGSPVAMVYPDQQEGQLGTLFIPNTVAMIRGAAHPREAEQLFEFLVGPWTESALAEGPSAQIPLNPAVPASDRVRSPQEVRGMEVDFGRAAENWINVASRLRETFSDAN